MTALDSAKWLLALIFFMALTAPFLMVEGAGYVDKPVCDGDNGVCTCDGAKVTCDENLPEPARWKDLDKKWTDVYIDNDELAKLEKGAFKGLSARRLVVERNEKLESIDAGTFDGVTCSRDLRLALNPKLGALKANTFDGLTTNSLSIENNGIETIESDAFNGLIRSGNLDISSESKLTSIEENAFRGIKGDYPSEVYLAYNDKLEKLTKGSFNGMKAYKLTIHANKVLATIEKGTFDGLSVATYL